MREVGLIGGIISYFTRHRTVANLLLVAMIVAGLVATPRMRAQFFPDVVVDNVSVSVTWDGAGAEDVDAGIVQVLEPALLAVEGVAEANSTSREGVARIALEFEPGWDMARAADDVQAAVDFITLLPEEADEPQVSRGVWRDRVTDVVITGPVGAEQLARFADEFVARLFEGGVTRTTIRGVAGQKTNVIVATRELIKHDITFAQIAAAIGEEVKTDPAGTVTGANARVRTGVEKRSPEQISQIVLKALEDGSKLTVGDVAQIEVEGALRGETYFVGANPAISVRVDRSANGDAIGIQHAVEEVAEKLEATLPPGVSIDLIRTRAEAITGRLDILLDNGLVGLFLVVGLLFLFLNARTAFWVAAGIPVSMLAAIALMYAFGLTFNMISLFALIITLGIVVDDAIVVGEHADARLRKLREGPVEAAENAAKRMAMPVFSATLTTVIAFFALTMVGGRFGDMISDIPFTVVVVLLASLVECFLILPNHMAHSLKHAFETHWYDMPSRVVNRGFEHVRERLFRPVMAWVVKLRYPVMAAVVLVLASQVAMLVRGDVQWRFFNAPEQASISGNFAMVPGATREDTFEMMRLFQQVVETLGAEYEEKYGANPIDYVIAQVGGNTGRGLAGADTKDPDELGAVAIELIDADLRPYSSFAFLAELQERLPTHPLLETVSFRGWRSGPGGDALDVQFYGADANTLKAASEALKEAVAQYPEVSAVEDDLAYDKGEFVLDLNARGQALGFTIDGVGRELRHRLSGLEAATYPEGARSAEIRVELPEDELTADFIYRTQMRAPGGQYAALSDIVSVREQAGFSTIRRENGLRTVSVTGDISEDDAARAAEIMTVLEQTILPRIASRFQVEWRLAGLSEQEDEFLNDALTGFILCLVGIYLVLAWVFASWTRPAVVMAIIPFGLVGTIYGHAAWDVPLSMFTVVGLLGMTGIIINDSIVLITTIDDYAEERGLVPSIIDGAVDRLRPVLLTTLTTVLGLAPLLYEKSQQAQFLKPTVITLVYGLGFGMVLVLLVVPALIAMQADFARQTTGLRRAVKAKGARGVQLPVGIGAALIGIWFALSIGWFAAFGSLSPAIAPVLSATTALGALGLFLAGSVVILVLVAAVGFGAALKMRQSQP
ncbi:efflux RND transporter permease subunit [Lentibacter sp. XHP0401]|uniref:efflux RND transporter permease subunit n=1 Tax=Lentibacter sp. XHP0401 TaxID=2984334 RepID=UPI0021E99490|nr:efflux RND transporter permease subunit [Lentibacter sp. XHP0401]MCV2892920.1 efflux RND transporter permease subunit [Lentibacter sp. XHP0401]